MGLAAAAGSGWPAEWIGPWAAQDVAYTCAAGVLGGLLMGRLLGWLFFRTRSRALRLSQHRESFIALGGLSALTWRGAITACAVLLVIRSLSGWAGLPRSSLESRERWVVAAYGVRGIGSLYYLAYALGQHGFALPERELWAVVTFTVLASVVAAAIYTANRDSVLVKKDADLAE